MYIITFQPIDSPELFVYTSGNAMDIVYQVQHIVGFGVDDIDHDDPDIDPEEYDFYDVDGIIDWLEDHFVGDGSYNVTNISIYYDNYPLYQIGQQ